MKRDAPATERNRDAILEVLSRVLPAAGTVLEIAAGTGQHAAYFAAAHPGVQWQPTDADPGALASIAAWRAESGLANLRAPVPLDVATNPWPVTAADAIVNINMIHISPWTVCEALMAGAGRVLAAGAPLYLYGPMLIDDRPTAPSNVRFDGWLRDQDPRWGIRWLHDVVAEAARHGLAHEHTVDMPANNVSVVFRRQ